MSDYPAELDVLPVDVEDRDDSTTGDPKPGKPAGAGFHASLHNAANAAIAATQATLGVDPQGAEDTVADRLGAMDAGLAAHAADTTGVHGIADTAALALKSELGGGSSWFVDASAEGAVGDGVADDSDALQGAIDKAIAAGRPLYLPPGEYRTTKALVADTDFFAIFGAGARESEIVPATSAYHALSIGAGEGPNNGPSGYARDFGIGGGSAEVGKAGAGKTSGKAALHLNSMALFEVSNVRVYGTHDIGFDLENNCFGSSFRVARTELNSCRVAVNLRVGAENGEDILFTNCWFAGEVAAVHITQGKNYRFVGGQLSASRETLSPEDLRGVFVIGKDYLTGEAGGDSGVALDGASIEWFQHCWALRAFKQVALRADAASFNASGVEPALGFYKNTAHAASQVNLDNCLFEGDYSAGAALVEIEGDNEGSTWWERGSWGSYTDHEGEDTSALWNNMARIGEVARAYGARDGTLLMMAGLELREDSGGLQVSSDYGASWDDLALATPEIETYTFNHPAPTAAVIGGFFLRVPAGFTFKLLGVRMSTVSGSCKVKLKRTTPGGTTTTPVEGKEAKTEPTEHAASLESLTDKDRLLLEVESVSSPTFLIVSVMVEKVRA